MKVTRRSLLARVHIAKKELGLSDDEYLAILQERFGVESAKDMSILSMIDLCEHFKALGWVQKPKKKMQSGNFRTDRLLKKVWALCYSMELPVPEYADGLAKRMYKMDKVGWLNDDQLMGVVTALSKHQKKQEEK